MDRKLIAPTSAADHMGGREISAEGSIEQILGVQFFNGTAEAAVRQAMLGGGLVVAPSGTCFDRFLEDAKYRRAILTANLVLPDSGFIVVLWRLIARRKINRISGLAYLQALLSSQILNDRDVFWILPNERSRERLFSWSNGAGLNLQTGNAYVAPIYLGNVEDEALLHLLATARPKNIVIGIGAGPQEKLGWYLRENLPFRPTIHCIGGALGFITGDQVTIPGWADRFYLGWLFRLISQPSVFIPRLWRGRLLPRLILRYGRDLPPPRGGEDY